MRKGRPDKLFIVKLNSRPTLIDTEITAYQSGKQRERERGRERGEKGERGEACLSTYE